MDDCNNVTNHSDTTSKLNLMFATYMLLICCYSTISTTFGYLPL